MLSDSDLIRKAFAAYDSERYETTLAALSPPTLNRGRAAHNTIFCKPPVPAGSYEYFRSLRRASGHNAYFHIPFCRTECVYCSYERVGGPTERLIDEYLAALETEIDRKRAILTDNFFPDIFYLGGGTPTLLSPRGMDRVLRMLGNRFDLLRNREFTVETTPRALLRPEGEALVAVLREHGVNRINVGVQSFSEKVARQNGRLQSERDIRRCFALLRSAGFQKINLDLIYGLLGQTPETWLADLEKAVDVAPDSVTTFSLRVRPPSRLYDLVKAGLAKVPAEREMLVMRMMAQEFLAIRGYVQDNADYFIRSADKRYLYQPFQPDNVDRNLIGFGPSAYSLAGDRQIFNVVPTEEYLRLVQERTDPIGEVIELDREEYMRKRLAEGLRNVVDGAAFLSTFGVSAREAFSVPLDNLEYLGLLEGEEDLRLTQKGKVLHDYVAAYINYAPCG